MLFTLKHDSQESFTTHRDPQWHKRVKNAVFKIWPFLTQNCVLTPWQKVDFWTKNKYCLKRFQSNQYDRKSSLEHFFALPRDQGQRISPQIFFTMVPIESVCPKTSPETLSRPPKGPETKKQPTKDGVKVREKKKKPFSARYLHDYQGSLTTRRDP